MKSKKKEGVFVEDVGLSIVNIGRRDCERFCYLSREWNSSSSRG